MKFSNIKLGHWYETKLGIGECISAGKTFPPSVGIRITLPFPRGCVNLSPKDVYRQVQRPERHEA